MTRGAMNCRTLLATSLGAACCMAASPLVTPMVLASAPGDNRLVVIILRGAMDGLAAFPPLGDPALAAMRPKLGRMRGVLHLNERFGLHPELAPLLTLWGRGELAVVQAVATPYRGKRSHFDGQDLLESGGSHPGALHDGWLNRALTLMPGARAETALSVGRDSMLLMRGEAPSRAWSPGDHLRLGGDERTLLYRMYGGDPLFQRAALEARALAALAGTPDKAGSGEDRIARFAGERLAAEARIAAFSIGGWDTHVGQADAIIPPLRQLATAISTLASTMGPAWRQTLVIAMTEFGRTARENGSGGTDHGTGGAALLAGGAVRGGQIYGDWPGLRERALYQHRDIMPTTDVRILPAVALAALFGIGRSRIEGEIFPGLDMAGHHEFLA